MRSYAVIMAGGTGTRFWPLSRREKPKQSHRLLNGHTMFQETIDRIKPMFDYDKIFIVAGSIQASMLFKQVPDVPISNYIIEPEQRPYVAENPLIYSGNFQ